MIERRGGRIGRKSHTLELEELGGLIQMAGCGGIIGLSPAAGLWLLGAVSLAGCYEVPAILRPCCQLTCCKTSSTAWWPTRGKCESLGVSATNQLAASHNIGECEFLGVAGNHKGRIRPYFL